MEAVGEFILVVVGVEFRAQVDVALRQAQRAEIAANVFRVRRALDHGRYHEGGVDHLAEAELFGKVMGPLNSAAAGLLPSSNRSMRLNSMPSSKIRLISPGGMYCSSAWMVE